MSFDGFPEAALDFYDDLEIDNSKFFWEQHKETYRTAVAEPMTALTEELADEFGAAKLFRPYRDVRFSKDKSPYKTHQGAFVAVAPATGYYIQIGAPGVRVGAGFYEAGPARLAELRKAIDHDRHGPELERIVRKLAKAGWEIGGDRLKTAPRGYDADHPRIELLRHKSLFAGRDYGFDEVIHTPTLVDRVRKDWRETNTLVDWIVRHAAT
ncbi:MULTISPECIES: DUF2461 domain-containing protein [Gordonia]|jgi:uncharacterized protein (TIGR02453 family)|uniref:TIGR02453 family protein n=1 Tax=Gordonia alkanivorans NBRC 16433 TaxID=1027371 RepID=F9W0Z8_9ACTN|nr:MULTISPECIES: DUF2461 domain-containing protein [Gordonia]MDH3008055.1 DUF2461 domain-containing protein [Gordonia alkanivorans]MDH3020920.1 DUF2461 domain-containing protein [Gordonia alkanivorans]MDH3026543.1 DUF2461 domain-containing protein [Gordonia alkanivorans]MDH3047815.1 DUF2461 domain-containing protein [Gordonia alkanivorans]MDH3052160.1 DUF2461 domain-containing protein [Gordonia alkanivorans]